MSEWINVKKELPKDGEFVKFKVLFLFKSKMEALYVKKYFVRKGKNITKWVTHWMPLPAPPQHQSNINIPRSFESMGEKG